jgi:putative transcriptional regulator
MVRQPENSPEQVKEARRQMEHSQVELTHALGMSFAMVNRWENGKTMPSKLAIKQFTAFCATNTRSGKLNLEDKDVTP